MRQVFSGFVVLAALAGALLALPVALAQVAPPMAPQLRESSGPTGTVTGRVVCADTQHPARFAQVTLVAANAGGGEDEERRRGPRQAGAQTDLEGNFVAANVPVGDYYVTGSAVGYISSTNSVRNAVARGADISSISGVPLIHVGAGANSANLTLERGASISGSVQWDDGTPATGVMLSVVASNTSAGGAGFGFGGFPQGAGFFFSSDGGVAQTDDLGHFRLVGLNAGEYVVRAILQAPAGGGGRLGFSRTTPIVLYAPGKVRRSEATTVSLHQADDRRDVQFVLDLRALHTVSGRVSAASGGVSVGSGNVRVVDSDDSSLSRFAAIAADGSYTLTYVPAGNYTLSVNGAGPAPVPGSDGPRGGRDRPSAFQPLRQALTVTDTDVSGVNLTLTPATQTSAAQ